MNDVPPAPAAITTKPTMTAVFQSPSAPAESVGHQTLDHAQQPHQAIEVLERVGEGTEATSLEKPAQADLDPSGRLIGPAAGGPEIVTDIAAAHRRARLRPPPAPTAPRRRDRSRRTR